MFIRSERLFLRPGWPEDWEELLALINDETVVRNLAKAPWPYTADDAREFARRAQERLAPHFLVTLPTAEGTKLIGSAGLGPQGDNIELGYWIARSHWGQGYATEAARSVLSLAAALGHRRVVAHHFTDNPASGRVLLKAGFRPTGGESMRYSAGRGREALALDYVRELSVDGDPEDDLVKLAA
ncbi:MAG: GNAT family N-acetyltransferase [Novosphingobium sp.]|nr:GNAT family N-acetyltransferase [Novosphingobium sp.]